MTLPWGPGPAVPGRRPEAAGQVVGQRVDGPGQLAKPGQRGIERVAATSSPSGSGPGWAAAAVGAIRPGGVGMQMSLTRAKTQLGGPATRYRPRLSAFGARWPPGINTLRSSACRK
jgi:hypothetical protein